MIKNAGHHLYIDNPIDCVKTIMGFVFGESEIIKFNDSFGLTKIRQGLYEVCLSKIGTCECNH